MNWSVLTIAAIMIIPGSVALVYPGSGENKIQYQLQSRMEAGEKPNNLIHEKSPYLLQHAFNPIDWYPWGKEPFSLAEREDKPIFLSIGYSTCHWCHVMADESFENDELAALLNQHFVSIKVDREERPDADQSSAALGLDKDLVTQSIDSSKAKLLKTRELRTRPHLDDKVITGWNGQDTRALLEAVQKNFDPARLVLLADGGENQSYLAEKLAFLQSVKPINGLAAAYVCTDFICKIPVTDPHSLQQQLAGDKTR